MPKRRTLKECFAEFGATAKNPRNSWSARSADGKVVVVTVWKDQLDYRARPIVFDNFGRSDLHSWIDRPGNKDRINDLIWARDHCDGLFRVVITEAEDVKANPRQIAHCYPLRDWVMRLIRVDE